MNEVSVPRLLRWIAAVCIAALFSSTASGVDIIREAQPHEVALLPDYCIHTQIFRDVVPGGNDPTRIRHWYATMGDTFHAMHHYCYGLIYLNRAKISSRDLETRVFNYNNAVMEFDYVLDRAPESFVLLPEILTKKGEALLGQSKAALAIQQFERAIELKPDYWPPYAQMSDYYLNNGDSRKARTILKQGLTQAPDAKGLQRRLRELDDADKGKAASKKQR